MKNLYYAMGGGLGHLTRARAFLQMFGAENETAILSASKFAFDKRVVGNTEIIHVDENYSKNPQNYRAFLEKILQEKKPDSLFLDVFPAGIVGEFSDISFGKTKIYYIARQLRWKKYSSYLEGFSIQFEKTYVLEELETEHLQFIKASSNKIENFEITYPQIELITLDKLDPNKTFWLIVHSGEESEIIELIKYAEEMREIESADAILVLISPQKLNSGIFDFIQTDVYPASMLFESAERIFTACGFNVMKQTEKFREKHFFIPFERRYDDQFKRAARAKCL